MVLYIYQASVGRVSIIGGPGDPYGGGSGMECDLDGTHIDCYGTAYHGYLDENSLSPPEEVDLRKAEGLRKNTTRWGGEGAIPPRRS
jgi:hypothetical protein